MMELTPQNFRERILIGHAPKVTIRHRMSKQAPFTVRCQHEIASQHVHKPMRHTARVALLTLTLVTAMAQSTNSLAGPAEIKAAEAIATTLTYYEKCTGDTPSQGKLGRIVKSLLSAGMTPRDFETGSKRAMTDIERLYPGRARPPQNVCTEAVKLYNEAFGSM
jgi:hypothetical protein